MKKMFKLSIYLLVALSIFSCKKEDEPSPSDNDDNASDQVAVKWEAISNFNLTARDAAVAFAIDGKGYVGCGQNYPTFFDSFSSYNPQTNTWTSISDYEGGERRTPVSFVVDDTAFVMLGYEGVISYPKDLWKYDAINDDWIPMNAPNFGGYEGMRSMVIDNVAYIILKNRVYMYDKPNDSWIQKSIAPFTSRDDAVTFTIGSKGYFGTGVSTSSSGRLDDFWEYDPSEDKWTEVAKYPGGGVNSAVGFTLKGEGYVGTGNSFSSSQSSFYRYSASKNKWTKIDDYPGGATTGMVSFVINDTAYVGTGIGNSEKTSFYKLYVK